jgi:hypothetical protein
MTLLDAILLVAAFEMEGERLAAHKARLAGVGDSAAVVSGDK